MNHICSIFWPLFFISFISALIIFSLYGFLLTGYSKVVAPVSSVVSHGYAAPVVSHGYAAPAYAGLYNRFDKISLWLIKKIRFRLRCVQSGFSVRPWCSESYLWRRFRYGFALLIIEPNRSICNVHMSITAFFDRLCIKSGRSSRFNRC